MSQSLSIECEWIDQPAASDPLERQTWADIRMRAAGRAITRVWDRQSQAERTSIFIPALPLACWIVKNWWSLLFEACRTDEVPASDKAYLAQHRPWLRRHCFRSAEAGLLLPRVCLFNDGENVCVDWIADSPQAYSHMPAEFIESGRVWLPVDNVQDGLREFIHAVLERIEGSDDRRATWLCENWNAIVSADSDETMFCRLAGRLGLDPYLSNQWEPSVVELLESGFGPSIDHPITTDFLEVTDPTVTAPVVWNWIKTSSAKFELRDSPKILPRSWNEFESPANVGYRLARELRTRLGIQGRVANPAEAAEAFGINSLTFKPENHLPTSVVRAVVGWQSGKHPVIVGPEPPRSDNKRFLEARASFLTPFYCDRGPRLLTSAHTWPQKASRAFAAEFLIPQSEIIERWTNCASSSDTQSTCIESLAKEYEVSTKVVQLQLQNAGVEVCDEG